MGSVLCTCCIISSTAAVKIIGAGWGRTGTTSLQVALVKMGFKTYHINQLLFGPVETIHQCRNCILKRNTSHWKVLLKDFDAVVDFPFSAVYADILVAFPQAKVILTVRDPNEWFDSISRTWWFLGKVVNTPICHGFGLCGRANAIKQMSDAYMLKTLNMTLDEFLKDYHTKPEILRSKAVSAFTQNHNQVTSRIPTERLLVFNVTEHGYLELNKFLGIPAQKLKFPHSYDTISYMLRIALVQLLMYLSCITLASICILLAHRYVWNENVRKDQKVLESREKPDIWALFVEATAKFSDKVCVIDGTFTFTYSQIYCHVLR